MARKYVPGKLEPAVGIAGTAECLMPNEVWVGTSPFDQTGWGLRAISMCVAPLFTPFSLIMRLYFLIKLQLLAFGSECVYVCVITVFMWHSDIPVSSLPFPSWSWLTWRIDMAQAHERSAKGEWCGDWAVWSLKRIASEMRVQWYIKTSPDVGRAQCLFVAFSKYKLH